MFSGTVFSQSFKKLYKESFKYLEVQDYPHALPILMKMYEMKPDNANTNFSIGNCLMNISHREYEAIPYYEKSIVLIKKSTVFILSKSLFFKDQGA